MFTAPISAFILLVLVASTGFADTSAFQTSSDVNSEHPDDPITCPPVPVVPPRLIVPAPPPEPDEPACPPLPAVPLVAIEPPPHPTPTINAAANDRRCMRPSYTPMLRRAGASPPACNARRRRER